MGANVSERIRRFDLRLVHVHAPLQHADYHLSYTPPVGGRHRETIFLGALSTQIDSQYNRPPPSPTSVQRTRFDEYG